MTNRNSQGKQDRQQPYPNGQTPDPTPAPMFTPAPPQVFRSEHAARSFEARQRAHYAVVSTDAADQASHAAWLTQTIAELRAENHQDSEVIGHAEQVIRERQDAMRQRDDKIAKAEKEREEKSLQCQNNRDDADATVELLRLHGFQVPGPSVSPRDVLVAPVTDPAPTGALEAPEECPCGDPMQWDRQQNQFVHPLPDGGWEAAGESCKRRRESTQVMPAADSPAVAS